MSSGSSDEPEFGPQRSTEPDPEPSRDPLSELARVLRSEDLAAAVDAVKEEIQNAREIEKAARPIEEDDPRARRPRLRAARERFQATESFEEPLMARRAEYDELAFRESATAPPAFIRATATSQNYNDVDDRPSNGVLATLAAMCLGFIFLCLGGILYLRGVTLSYSMSGEIALSAGIGLAARTLIDWIPALRDDGLWANDEVEE